MAEPSWRASVSAPVVARARRHVRSSGMRVKLRTVCRFVVFVVAIVTIGAWSGSSSKPAAAKPTPSSTLPHPAYRLDDQLRLNQVQVLGSHNSYHASPYPKVLATLRRGDPTIAAGLDYGHRPLAGQFPLGVRQIELD